jgi:hypothetical protein
MGLRIVLLMIAVCLAGTGWLGAAAEPMTIDIDVLSTWQADYAQEILDLAWGVDYGYEGPLLFRSNQDGMIFMADPEDGSFLGEIALPSGSSGFGLCWDYYAGENRYFINSDLSPLVFHTDGAGVWDSFPNPAGAGGMGMSVDFWSTGLAEVCPTSSNLLYTFQGDGTGVADYLIQGITGTMSGLAAHEVATSDRLQAPSALVVTCSDQPEFFFLFNNGSLYYLYGQEPCPVTVDQSLGITFAKGRNTFFWSYRGLDGEYYVSELFIPILGTLESATWAAVKAGIRD